LSSPSPAPAASPTLVEQALAGASPATPSSPAGTTNKAADSQAAPAAPQIAARPADVPEFLWDADKGAIKIDSVKELAAFKAAEDVRKGALPPTADAYKAELPADFKAPAGVAFKIDANDPLIPLAQAQAHAMGASQEDFSKMLGIYAAAKAGEQAQIESARSAEVSKLGPTAPARVDAVTRWLTSIDGSADKGDAQALAGMLVTARHVEAFERMINRFTSQGAAPFSQQHRDVPDGKLSEEDYGKLSFGEKKAYAAKFGAK
jgi:hypothetical protein